MATPRHPYLRLVEIQHQCREALHRLPLEEKVIEIWSSVGFILNGTRFVAPMDEVAEILTMPRITPVPGVGGWIKGIANVRGRLLPVIDLLGFFIGNQPAASAKLKRLLVIEAGDIYAGLIVDDVLGMQHFAADSYQNRVINVPDAFLSAVIGSYQQGQQIWPIFSPLKLLDDQRFMKLAV
jgi:twitching motility protein PilI